MNILYINAVFRFGSGGVYKDKQIIDVDEFSSDDLTGDY